MEREWELARKSGYCDSDRTEYLSKKRNLVGLGANTGKNLRTAIEDYSDQVKMYTRFKDAKRAAAALFEKVVRDKVSRRAVALERLCYASSVHLVGA